MADGCRAALSSFGPSHVQYQRAPSSVKCTPSVCIGTAFDVRPIPPVAQHRTGVDHMSNPERSTAASAASLTAAILAGSFTTSG